MKKIFKVILVFFVGLSPMAAAQTLVFNTTSGGFPPFFIKGELGESGIMYDVMKYISSKHGVELETVGLPKKRITLQMDAGKIGANASAKEWIKDPDKYIFSDVVIKVKDVLFSLKETPLKFSEVDDLFGKSISIHHGYRYPMFDQYFSDGRIKTLVENNETMMLKSTLFKRADGAVINEMTANWIIKNDRALQNKFVVSAREVESFDFRIMFSKKWQNFAAVFNAELALMKGNGELQKILDKYQL